MGLRARSRASIPARVHRADERWFGAIARWHAPALDRTLPTLSHAANKSALWAAIAVLLGLSGNRQARRAALRGLISVAATSAIANLSKHAFRRSRPDRTLLPQHRTRRRAPSSTSFPSGHAASAAAFATGVALEMPALGAPVGALAAGVAFSRIYTGAHYPSDVLAGLALGTGIGLATTKTWPRANDEPAFAPRATGARTVEVSPAGAGLAFVINPNAGPDSETPAPALREALPDARIVEIGEGDSLTDRLEEVADDAIAIGICGGDGSANAAAEVAHRRRKPLIVVPGGTLNHFAREIGVESVQDAIDAAREGETVEVDLGLIDGKPFLNTASFGVYPELVQEREKREDRLGKWPALAVALGIVLRRREPSEVEINGHARRVWAAFVGNCAYSPTGFAPSRRERLNDGAFDLRLVLAEGKHPLARLIGAALLGRLESCRAYEQSVENELKIRSLNGPLQLARDGESFEGPESFTIVKAREPLAVLVPRRES